LVALAFSAAFSPEAFSAGALASAFAAAAGTGAGFGAISSWVEQDASANKEATASAPVENTYFI
jgi:hypothetical protein